MMIRFIDIRAQGTGYRFAFWDTVKDKFFEFSGCQAWENFDDFFDDSFKIIGVEGIARYKNLCPDWAWENKEDNILRFYIGDEQMEKVLKLLKTQYKKLDIDYPQEPFELKEAIEIVKELI